VKLSPSFLEYAMTGIVPTKEALIPEYMDFLPVSQRAAVKAALVKFDPKEADEILDFCEDHSVTIMPTENNITTIIADTAHKEMIQKPTYIADFWREKLAVLKPYLSSSLGDYSSLIPNFKKVWENISFDTDLSEKQRNQKRYLKRFIKDMNEEALKSFLRFCTGISLPIISFALLKRHLFLLLWQ